MSETLTIRVREETCNVLYTDSLAIYKLHSHIFPPTNLTSDYMVCQELGIEIPLFSGSGNPPIPELHILTVSF